VRSENLRNRDIENVRAKRYNKYSIFSIHYSLYRWSAAISTNIQFSIAKRYWLTLPDLLLTDSITLPAAPTKNMEEKSDWENKVQED
jgi:hypothetical protein